MKISKILKKSRVLILLFFIVISFIAINPQLDTKGISIKYVEQDSTADLSGVQSPTADTSPTNYERILKINNQEIKTTQDYSDIVEQTNLNAILRITTNKQEYTVKKTTEDLGMKVQPVARTNIRTGLELSGGTRVVLKPETEITDLERDNLIQIMEYRLNTYGLSDISIRKADGQSNLFGGTKEKYIIVEIAGATEQEVSELIASQGLFEAKIANETVFTGGENDVTYVCRNDGTCSGVRDCMEIENGEYYCKFEFVIHLSSKAAKKHAEVTSDLGVIDGYLSEKIDFYLDEILVDSLNIGEDLKGIEATQIMISGPGIGETEEEAIQEALGQMNKLQTILLTGSLPVKLDIIKLDTISPILGEEFVKNAMLVGLLAILAVSIIIFLRYRNLKISIPVLIALISEVIIILGFSALIKYNLDLAAIAGIIAAVGTGVDDQIVIIDEVTKGELGYSYRWKERLKKAFFIIFAAYVTTVAAMLPLFRAGAGLLRGFALITILGITIGVFITRPAFATMMEKLMEE
jgi:preprotein translocase subunit SecD